MAGPDRRQIARDCYAAYESGDRRVLDERLTEDFVFYSPDDVGIDLATYFQRCWPNHESIASFEFDRLAEVGDEVIVTYELTKTDGRRSRNAEILRFRGDQVCRVEVYYGWA